MGLIAREIERRGIPTLSMTSSWFITQAVNPPRAAFLDFPLGHTSGRVADSDGNDAIMTATLDAFATIEQPGDIRSLPFRWADSDDWKDDVMRPAVAGDSSSQSDTRTERHPTPQYQNEEDAARAAQTLAAGGCVTCIEVE